MRRPWCAEEGGVEDFALSTCPWSPAARPVGLPRHTLYFYREQMKYSSDQCTSLILYARNQYSAPTFWLLQVRRLGAE